MVENNQSLTYYQKYNDAISERSIMYYENNKEKRKEYQRDRFHNMANEKRDKLNEYQREWCYKLDEEKKKIRKDAQDSYYALKVC